MVNRSKLAVILHADIVGSTALVQRDERIAHQRIQETFQRFSKVISNYGGVTHELRGDALLAEFERASDSVSAALAFQAENKRQNDLLSDGIEPEVRVGIALGEVVIADKTITGAGVVLAQRLEQLADPGSLCISSAIREAMPARLAFDYGSLGEQEVKGFDEPVRVFFVTLGDSASVPEPEPVAPIWRRGNARRVAVGALAGAIVLVGITSWLQPWRPDFEPVDPNKLAYALPDRPSVAVMPFANMSADKQDEYFSDAIAEDIITDLSKISGVFIVARNSTFSYKGKPVESRKVAEDLGVRYVLEGSVQRSADKIRVTVQLIDAVKGNHLWAERYDRDLKDLFSVQSEVAKKVAKALAVTLTANENERLFQKYTSSIDAYDVYLKARRVANSPSRTNIAIGKRLFGRVIELDPKFSGGYAGLSFVHSVKARFRYGSPPEDRLRALELAEKAVEVDRDFAWAHIALAGARLSGGDPAGAVDAVRQALALEPNGYDANLFMGLYLQFAGEPALAVEHLERANRLSPVDTVRKLAFLGRGYFMNGDYDNAVRVWTTRYRKFPVSSPNGFVYLAAAYSLLNRPEDAAATVVKLLEAFPNFKLSQWKYIDLYKSEEDRSRLYEAAKKAGVPEPPSLGN